MFCYRCIYNPELAEAIKSHGKILVLTGAAGGSDTAPSVISLEDVGQSSNNVDSTDYSSLRAEAASGPVIQERPLFLLWEDSGRADVQGVSAKPQKLPVPPGFDLEVSPPSKRGRNYFYMLLYYYIIPSVL